MELGWTSRPRFPTVATYITIHDLNIEYPYIPAIGNICRLSTLAIIQNIGPESIEQSEDNGIMA
jgi:hypothetical protein